MSRTRYLISTLFLLSGATLFTYAATRTWITELVLEQARDHVRGYLETKNLLMGVSNEDADISENTDTESRQLLGRVHLSGGMYYWWNDALPYCGAGTVLFAVGILLPLVKSRTR